MGWLVDRLTPYKQKEPRWVDLARALETYWDTYNTPALDRIEQMRSVFRAHGEDVERLLNEAGVKFEVAVPIVESNRAFAYAWRSYEIHRKDNAGVMAGVLARDFSGVDVRWAPLYAPRWLPYGEGELLTRQEIELTGERLEDYHRTYRGVVLANLSGIQSVGHTTDSFSEIVGRKLDALRPAHIVHDGELFFQVFRAEITLPMVNFHRHEQVIMGAIGLWGHHRVYDDLAADLEHLDEGPLRTIHDTSLLTKPLPSWRFPVGADTWQPGDGSVVDGEYWGLHGLLGSPRQRITTLGRHMGRRFGTSTRLSPTVRGSYTGRAMPGYFTFGRYPFDVIRADDGELDEWHGVPFPGWQQHDSRRLVAAAPAWNMPLWSLDGGEDVGGDYWGLRGLEGSIRRRTLTIRGLAIIAPSALIDTRNATLSERFSLPLDTFGNSSETLSIRASADLAARQEARQSGTSTTRSALPDFAAFDDLPADLAPLDMHYEEA